MSCPYGFLNPNSKCISNNLKVRKLRSGDRNQVSIMESHPISTLTFLTLLHCLPPSSMVFGQVLQLAVTWRTSSCRAIPIMFLHRLLTLGLGRPPKWFNILWNLTMQTKVR